MIFFAENSGWMKINRVLDLVISAPDERSESVETYVALGDADCPACDLRQNHSI